MPKKVFLLLIIVLFFSGCVKNNDTDLYDSILKSGKLVVGISFNSKPFGFKDEDGKVTGFEADLAREIAYRLLGSPGKVEFKDITPQDRINAVQSGYVDMVLSTMTITSQRKKLVEFSDPYFVAGQAICVKKDSKIDSHLDLINKKVIVIIETTGERNIRRFAPNALIQGYSDNLDAMNAFKNGLGDAITTDDSLLQGLVLENKDYIILPEKLTKEPYGIAFKKSKYSNSFKRKLNETLNEIHDDGTLDNLKYKWGVS
jgi:putative glutamine transport system substrate-binding protein